MSPSSPSSGVSQLTSASLGLLVFVCLTLIGCSGYIKYQLDRSEAALAAPAEALPATQDASEKLRRALGYSGFIGAAQAYLASHDHAALEDMRAQLKNGEQIIAKLPERTPLEARHDLQSILNLFAVVLKKAEDNNGASFSPADMAPLYASLPVLDDRVASSVAASRFIAEGDLKLWATLLTLIAWGSLVAASVCAAAFYLTLRGRNAAPFRALAQSVQNMARGDMRTPIWGMERQDMVGDLARAIDLARYHFSQLPDMSLLSEQGPIRIRFEGQARSLFEAMMQNISRDSESIRGQASGLAEIVSKEKETVTEVVTKVENALTHMYHERLNSEQQVQILLQTVGGSAQTLAGAQRSAEAQLSHLIAYLEERAKGMAEVTNIAGKQVASTLQSLSHTEQNLRASAEQNQVTVQKLAASTDELGERLFGAVSLLRAGGKVLTETAEETQSRLNEAISLLSQSEGSLRQILVQGFEPVGRSLGLPPQEAALKAEDATRMQGVLDGLEGAQRKLEECLVQQNQASGTQIELLINHSNSLLAQASAAARTLVSVSENLKDEQEKLKETVVESSSRFNQNLDTIGKNLEQRITEALGRSEITMNGLTRLSELADQMGSSVERLGVLSQTQPSKGVDRGSNDLLLEIKTGFEITTRTIDRLREEFVNAALNDTSNDGEGSAAPTIEWEPIVEKINSTNTALAGNISQQADRIERRLASMDQKIGAGGMSPDEAQAQLKQQAQILSELASALGAIDAHMQEMGATFKSLGNAEADGRLAS